MGRHIHPIPQDLGTSHTATDPAVVMNDVADGSLEDFTVLYVDRTMMTGIRNFLEGEEKYGVALPSKGCT